MTIQYGSFFYFFYPALAVLLLMSLWFLFKNRAAKTRQTVVLVIAILNLLQHLLKSVLYPHLWGNGFTFSSTAYNVCAFLIILSPFALCSRSQTLKDFVCLTGIIAGLGTMLLPIWFIGLSAFQWEACRFYICHGLLLVSSALPLLLQTHTLSWKSWYKYAPLFVLMLVLILADNILCVYMGLVPGASPENLHETLLRHNPLWIMGPKNADSWITSLLAPLTPDFLIRDDCYVPILWYIWPLYLPMNFCAFLLYSFGDRKRFRTDIKHFFHKNKEPNL